MSSLYFSYGLDNRKNKGAKFNPLKYLKAWVNKKEEVQKAFSSKYSGTEALSEFMKNVKAPSFYKEEEAKEYVEDEDALEKAPRSKDIHTRYICGYEMRHNIGKGMSGKVKLGYSSKQDKYVALKIIDKRNIGAIMKMIDVEIRALKAVEHPHVLKFYAAHTVHYPKRRGMSREVTCLVLEYAKAGTLMEMVEFGPLPEVIARTYFHQLISALEFIHSKGIAHRDIKPENILFTEDFQLKLGDFGLAAISADPANLCKTEVGTRAYMAPEILQGKLYSGDKADVWSTGVVLFIMLSGIPPFQIAHAGDYWFHLLVTDMHEQFWEGHKRNFAFSPSIQVLISSILKPNPIDRPSMTEVLRDPWMNEPRLSDVELLERVSVIKANVEAKKEEKKGANRGYMAKAAMKFKAAFPMYKAGDR